MWRCRTGWASPTRPTATWAVWHRTTSRRAITAIRSPGRHTTSTYPPGSSRSPPLDELLGARQWLVLGEESVELGQGVLDDPVVGHGDSGRVRRVVAIGAELGLGVVEGCLTVGAHQVGQRPVGD